MSSVKKIKPISPPSHTPRGGNYRQKQVHHIVYTKDDGNRFELIGILNYRKDLSLWEVIDGPRTIILPPGGVMETVPLVSGVATQAVEQNVPENRDGGEF